MQRRDAQSRKTIQTFRPGTCAGRNTKSTAVCIHHRAGGNERIAAMARLPIYDRSGAEVGQYEIDPAEFAPRISRQLLHDAVVMYQANQRQGTVRTKGRSEIASSTRKIYRQKGTGNARAGSRRSGLRRGGGDIHPRRPRDWSYRLTKKAIKLATSMALVAKITDNEITLIDQLRFERPRTKEMTDILTALKLTDGSLLVAVEGYDLNIYRSIRNLTEVSVLPVSDLNALHILKSQRLLMTTAALDAFRTRAATKE